MDILNIDLALQNQYADRRKPKAKPAAKKSKKKVTSDEDYEDDEAAYHFIAYVPIQGRVWKFDGLDRQPQKLGLCNSEDWLSVVKPILEDRMSQYMEGQIQFVLLSLVKDPLDALRESLILNIKSLIKTGECLTKAKPEWESYITDDLKEGKSEPQGLLLGSDLGYRITNVDIEEALIPHVLQERLMAEERPEQLLAMRSELVTEQAGLREAVREELERVEDDERYAAERRHDYGPAIHTWLRMASEKR